MRWISFLVVFLYCGLLGWVAYNHNQHPSPNRIVKKTATTVGKQTITTKSKPRVVVPSTFRIYYEKDPIPAELIQFWAAQTHFTVIQQPLKLGTNNQWPTDGDLYLVSPRWLASLESQVPLIPVADKNVLREINPAFASHPFDPNNQYTVPWRWTPYVFYLRHDKDLPWDKNREVFYFREWVNDPRCLWPNDWDLLLAMETHYQNKSANRPLDNYAELIVELEKKYNTVTAPEADCWQALLDGKIHFTFLPASLKIFGAADEKLKDIEIQVPGLGNNAQSAFGTIIYMDQLVISDKSLLKDQARGLIAFLLNPAQQSRLIQNCGYFPVVSKIGHEYDIAPVPLPRLHWFSRSEFLINRPPQLPAPPVVPTALPVSPAPAVSPTTPSTPTPAVSDTISHQ
jgi:hypothetical protein